MEITTQEMKFLVEMLGVFKKASEHTARKMLLTEQLVDLIDKFEIQEEMPDDIKKKMADIRAAISKRQQFDDDLATAEGLLTKLKEELLVAEPQS